MPAWGVMPISPSSRCMPPVVFLRLRASSSARRYSRSCARLRSSSSRSFAARSAYHSGSWVFTYGESTDADVGLSSSIRPTMEIRPRLWSFSRSSFVQTIGFWLSVPVCGLLAARKGMAAETTARQTEMHRCPIMLDAVTSSKSLEGSA